MVDHQTKRIVANHYIALATDIGVRFVADSLLVDKRIAGKNDIAKLAIAVVFLEILVGVWVLPHRFTQCRQCETIARFVHQYLLQTDDIRIHTIDMIEHSVLGLQILADHHSASVVGNHTQLVAMLRRRLPRQLMRKQ